MGSSSGNIGAEISNMDTLARVVRLKEGLTAVATGKSLDEEDPVFKELRRELRKDAEVYANLPEFVRSCTGTREFWNFIRSRYPSYQERREFLRVAFAPVIQHLEAGESKKAYTVPLSQTLENFDSESVHSAWEKALSRRADDPEGAITAARTLVETVCKHILDDAGIPYNAADDLPKLWHSTSKLLNLTPSQQQDELLKSPRQ